MARATLARRECEKLLELFEQLAAASCETIKSLVGRDLTTTPGHATRGDRSDLLGLLAGPYAAARGELDKDFEGHSITALLAIPDAIAVSGMLMMTPDEVIAERRNAGAFQAEDAEAFGEVANVLFSGLSGALRDKIENIDARLQNHGSLTEDAAEEFVTEDDLVVFEYEIVIGDFPATKGYLVIDAETAERWNDAPLAFGDASAGPDSTNGGTESFGDGTAESELEQIPAAPIQGRLAAFIALPDIYPVLRQSCRRVGLELHRHGKSEIPNPAAHRDEIVLLDVPPGEERQFDWCKRIKGFAPETRVVLLLHLPSRQNVRAAFLSKADAVLGLPCAEPQLSQKLAPLVSPENAPVPSDEPT